MEKAIYDGVVDITNEAYHSSAGISRSGILEFQKCPKKYWYRYENPDYLREPSTKAMDMGTAFHMMVLEPEKFSAEYCLAPKINKTTKIGKAAYADLLIKNKGKTFLNVEDYNKLDAMRQTLLDDDEAAALIQNAKYEQSIYWTDPETGLLCKCRPDIWHKDFIVDLKTTEDAGTSFKFDFWRRGYHIQLGMMQEGLKHALGEDMTNFIDLAIEKDKPHCHGIFIATPEAIQKGVDDFKTNLRGIALCIDKNYWPSYPPVDIDVFNK